MTFIQTIQQLATLWPRLTNSYVEQRNIWLVYGGD